MKAYNRCAWCGTDPLYQAYHDNEWGKPSYDDRHLFAMLCLEGMQAGLSWITILKKRERYYQVFADFDPDSFRANCSSGESQPDAGCGSPGNLWHLAFSSNRTLNFQIPNLDCSKDLAVSNSSVGVINL